jgi:hypothetical protein
MGAAAQRGAGAVCGGFGLKLGEEDGRFVLPKRGVPDILLGSGPRSSKIKMAQTHVKNKANYTLYIYIEPLVLLLVICIFFDQTCR